jgi:hypothetical protein
MTEAQLIALIVREGLPTAMTLAEIFRNPAGEVTEAQLARLKELGSRTASDYEKERQG